MKVSDEGFEKRAAEYLSSLPPLRYEHHTGQLDNVLTAVEKGEKPAITGEDGRRTIELITAIYKAGSGRMPVEFPLKPDDPFYTVEGIRRSVPHFYEKTVSVMEQAGSLTFGSDMGEKTSPGSAGGR